MLNRIDSRRAIRFLQVSLAVLALLVFAIVVGSGLHHHDSTDDSHCPYCNLRHQSAAEPENIDAGTPLAPLAPVPISRDEVTSTESQLSESPSRAPPAVL